MSFVSRFQNVEVNPKLLKRLFLKRHQYCTSALSLSLSLFLSPSRMMRCASSHIDGLQLAGRASAAIR